MVGVFGNLSSSLAAKLTAANVDLSDGLQQKEVDDAGLTADEIEEISGKYQVDEGVKVDDSSDVETIGSLDDLDVDADDYGALTAKKQEIEADIAQATLVRDNLKTAKLNEEDKLKELNDKYQDEAKKLEDKENEFNKLQNKLADLNDAIALEQKREQSKYENKIGEATAAALSEYDPEKHGDDFDAYLSDCLSNVGISPYALEGLNDDAKSIAGQANGIYDEIKTQAKVVKTYIDDINIKKASIGSLEKQISAKETQISKLNSNLDIVNEALAKLIPGAGLSPAEVLASVPEAEMDLIKSTIASEGIDLTARFENGNPKYIFALGQDEKFHLYEMDESGTSGVTFARTRAPGQGFDIVPSGSGYLNGLQDAQEGNGRAVYTFSSINECLTDGETCSEAKCYSTCSPLSFDVDGDGVHTSSKTVKYDIDGDGVVDTVNNSAEWVLAFDKDGDGKAGEDGSELFGDNTDLDGDGKKDGYANGFDALRALAEKAGLIGDNDDALDADDLKKLQDEYGLVMTKGYGGEAKSLSDLGITEINLSKSDTKLTKNFDGRHNDIMTQEGATFKVNGQTREYADIWNAKLDEADINKDSKPEINESDFDINSIDLDWGNRLLDKANQMDYVSANTKEVNYSGILTDGKISGKSAHRKNESAEVIMGDIDPSGIEENEEEPEEITVENETETDDENNKRRPK